MNSIEWRKSRRSGNNGACVEVARLDETTVGIRDSKDCGQGPHLRVSLAAWHSFLGSVRAGRFDW